MPRLSNQLIRSACRISPLVALLLRSCRDIPSAKNELRWISEHVSKTTTNSSSSRLQPIISQSKLFKLCKARSRGVPLQYILGTQPFGELEVKCRPRVLIPRSETEAYTLEVGRILLDEIRHGTRLRTKSQHGRQPLTEPEMKILDICSGTGCISLSLYAQLRHACPNLQVVGLDISPKAINLARENIVYNNLLPRQNQSISFHKGDILSPSKNINELIMGMGSPSLSSPISPQQEEPSNLKDKEEPARADPENRISRNKWDLIISNPPYISSTSFSRDTTRSVRNFEPKLALVPPPQVATGATDNDSTISLTSICCRPEDIFYARILDLSRRTLKPRRILFEVADLRQARRVVELALVSATVSGKETKGEEEDHGHLDGRTSLSDMFKVIEIWRDDPSCCSPLHSNNTEAQDNTVESTSEEDEKENSTENLLRTVTVNGREIPIRGSGNVRSVYFFTGQH
ncbi:putative mitochondrial N(5)-glutamine methyltransferase mtq1 [Rhypophila decipiens]